MNNDGKMGFLGTGTSCYNLIKSLPLTSEADCPSCIVTSDSSISAWSWKFFTWSCFLILFSVLSIQCYQCNSYDDPGCADFFDNTTYVIHACPEDSKYCRKVVQQGNSHSICPFNHIDSISTVMMRLYKVCYGASMNRLRHQQRWSKSASFSLWCYYY